MTDVKKNENMTFEEAMKGLESIVSKLEEGDVPLEQAINYFQEGMALSKMCHEKLQKVEKQMDFILKEDGELAPFSVQEEDENDK
ncbi:exodeoxyribonuclease VII small subunit [Bacillus spizizenii]|jgi:exodeoxyribonuclease VII small subunit|uniref:Exodeoxyribonuclease 7 small subunit n=1 Tax=Bacillus spizizenii (strain DSM 15029 / JCM 12233 / NBRC 101239 / NRRL B-23049 / TU-B-10) TaxID=1052585 RepID=G4NQ52_BACS4|nr:exodeoxyribonuclease VII small subunit [Bacillus spizizenii]AEP87301.1 exodeoxyribonuclease VII, small subunit [Bacillus spizizenii TU-B-10]KXJ37991.1 exodeoxyribonuclease VII small subunit [Bacillus spizizenii]MEC1435575.1 exodeoxyribonuclease VII small subunit [Bacillus spizizenii]MEC1587471.1 exodeoxyribonuclease VII small subunit [Bacillus spizizenii]OPG92679.1 exodeoxyribonuclease VII small subunit [Bacillus spizizenii]